MTLKTFLKKCFRKQTENIMQLELPETIQHSGYDFFLSPITTQDVKMLPVDRFGKIGHLRHEHYLKKYPHHFKGYKFYNNDEFIGYCWIMKKGANDSYFRIRKADAYLTEFYVTPDKRGRGYGPSMLFKLFEILKHEHIKTIALSVHPTNASAIKCYNKVGFHFIQSFTFLRLIVFTIPYYSV